MPSSIQGECSRDVLPSLEDVGVVPTTISVTYCTATETRSWLSDLHHRHSSTTLRKQPRGESVTCGCRRVSLTLKISNKHYYAEWNKHNKAVCAKCYILRTHLTRFPFKNKEATHESACASLPQKHTSTKHTCTSMKPLLSPAGPLPGLSRSRLPLVRRGVGVGIRV